MECKYGSDERDYADQWFELIDTLWNVNRGLHRPDESKGLELIDTLWNVNIDGLVITYDDVEN